MIRQINNQASFANKVSTKKVCHFTSVHPIDDIRIFHKECCSLAANGFDVTLIAFGDKEHEEERNGVKCISLHVPIENRIQRFFKRSKAVYKKALEVDADIYHFHDPELLPFGLRLKRKGKIVIFDSHEDIPSDIKNKSYINPFLRRILFILYKILEPFIIRKFDVVVSVTPHIIEKLKKYNPNTFQITNYPIVTNTDISSVEVEKFPIPTIFFAGGVNSLWMHEYIIKSLDSINFDVKYLIAGPASNEYLSKLKKLKSWDSVEYVGVISYSQVGHYYSKSHIGIALPNYTAAGGGKMGTLGNTKIFEIMKAGLPVICTDFILWKKIVDDNKCGICVDPKDVSAISKAIIKLMTNKQEAKLKGKNGENAILNQYNWGTQEIMLLDIYQNL